MAITPLETLADRVEHRLKLVGKTARGASIEAGMSPAGILNMQRAIRAGRKFNFRADSLERLARVLLTTEAWLMRGEGPEWAPVRAGQTPIETPEPVTDALPASEVLSPTSDVQRADVELPPRSSMPRDVPVLGTAAGSLEGAIQIDGIVEYVRRPPAMTGAADLYALYVINESMVPEHNPGDLRFVLPGRPARVGDTVVVQTRVGEHGPLQAYIKKLAKVTPDTLFLVQHNPAATLEIRRAYVLHMHRVLTLNELFGV